MSNPGIDGDSAFAEMGGATTPNLNAVEYNSKLVGVTFEGRQDIIKMLTGDEPLRTRREPDNEYDKKAVAVDAMIAETWQPIGYIAKDKNKDIAVAMDAGNEIDISIASLTGGDRDSKGKVKSYGVNIALSYEKIDAKAKDGYEPTITATNENSSELNYSQRELEALSHDSNVLAQIKALLGVKKQTKTYISRLLGKQTEVVVSPSGHVSLPGYMSGSKFPEQYYPEFDEDGEIDRIIEKFFSKDSDEKKSLVRESLLDMWSINKQASTGYGSAIHAALQNYDTYYKLGDKTKKVEVLKTKTKVGPNKALSKNPFLKKIVEDFHEKFGGDYIRLSEQFIWLHDKKLCGAIDRIKVIDADKKIIRIQDFKTNTDIHSSKYQIPESPFRGVGKAALKKGTKQKENVVEDTTLGKYWLQLSFYAYILKQYGYTVEGLDIYWLNPEKLCKGENAWEEFSHQVINIEGEV